MKRISLQDSTVDQLVERFTEIALEQDEAIQWDDNEKFTQLFWQMKAVENELKVRQGDQRRALIPLYNYSNLQVRLKAAIATLAVAPEAARAVLKMISEDYIEYPQGGDAGMMLSALDEGAFTPS
jgi:cytochrome c oxidase assembly protein Cox11